MNISPKRYSRLFSLAILASMLPLTACDKNDNQSSKGLNRPNPGQPNQPSGTTSAGEPTLDPGNTTGVESGPGDSAQDSMPDSTSSTSTSSSSSTTSTTSSTSSSSSSTSTSTDTDTQPKPTWMGDDFESSPGDWKLDSKGVWKIGEPTAPAGPGAKQGRKVVGTVLDGDYPTGRQVAELLSPEFMIPKGESARIRYWQWYNLGERDSARTQLRVQGVHRAEDIDGDWLYQHSLVGSSRSNWVQVIVDLPTVYEDRRAQLRFALEGRGQQSRPGWFMDDFQIEIGKMDTSDQDFENGWKDWSVQGSVWEIGKSLSNEGPKAFRGTGMAGTDLRGEYPVDRARVRSRLLSPRFMVPKDAKDPEVSFRQWFDLARGDRGELQIRVGYDEWRNLPRGLVTGDSDDKWEERKVDLSRYAGKEVQIGFKIDIQRRSRGALGWYLDDVKFNLK